MKKKLICLFTALISLTALVLSGCSNKGKDPWDFKKEDQGFYYYVIGDDGSPSSFTNKGTGAVILGLVDEETEIEELVIPEKLGGYTVKEIGAYRNGWYFSSGYKHSIYASGIKKIIFNHSCCIDGKYSISGFEGELVINADVKLRTYMYPTAKIIKFNVDIFSLTDYKMWSYLWLDEFRLQVIFDAVGGEQQTYVIAIKEDNLLPIPEIPTKNGYTFVGWYTDENYETKWNFEEDIVKENITLYAKWI